MSNQGDSKVEYRELIDGITRRKGYAHGYVEYGGARSYHSKYKTLDPRNGRGGDFANRAERQRWAILFMKCLLTAPAWRTWRTKFVRKEDISPAGAQARCHEPSERYPLALISHPDAGRGSLCLSLWRIKDD